MSIKREAAERVAKLARLRFSEAELDKYTAKFARVVKYIEKLGQLDTKGIEPTAHAVKETGHDSRLREDIHVKFKGVDDILNAAPEKDGRMVVVPKVI